MNDEVLNIKFKNKVKIVETRNGKYIEKKKNKDLTELYKYLEYRGFTNYPKIVEENGDKVRYEYIENMFISPSEVGSDIIKVLARLHYQTSYEKSVSRKKYKEIYEKLISNIDYLKDYYEKLILKIELSEYMSPCSYLIARNYSIILSSLNYSEVEVNKWYKIVKDKTKERVSIVHNNIRREHFIRGEELYLISWEDALVDTPILDLYKFYKREVFNYDFLTLFNLYNSNMGLSEEEKKLLLVLISIPGKIEMSGNEIEDVINAKNILDYIYATKDLITRGVFNVESDKTTNK